MKKIELPVGQKVSFKHEELGTLQGYLFKEGTHSYIIHNNPKFNGNEPTILPIGFELSWEVTNTSIPIKKIKGSTVFKMPKIDGKIGGYKVRIYPDHIMVGCTKVTKEQVLKVAKHYGNKR